MNELWIAVISAIVALSVAVLTFSLNEQANRKSDWRQKKFGYYQELLDSLSGIAGDGSDWNTANDMYANAYNKVGLIASQEVVDCLVKFQAEIDRDNPNKSKEAHDRLLKNLIMAIRKDIGLSKKDNLDTFPIGFIKAR